MKILQVIPYFVPAYGYGGPVKVCFDMSKEFVKRGHEVTVATTDTLDGKNRVKELNGVIDGVKIIRFRNISNRLAKRFNVYLPIGFYSWAKNNVRNFDVIHCHDFFTLQNIIISHFCKKYGVPYIIQPHGTLSAIRQESKFKQTKKYFLSLFKDILVNSKNIIALTGQEKKEIMRISGDLEDKIQVIPNGLRLEEFENIGKINLHEKFNIPKENKIIGYIGRLQYIKGIDISLEILASLKNKLSFTYLIIGPDEGEKDKLKRKIKELGLEKNVVFAGILTGKEKLETIKSCDVFLFTSRSEGLPMTVLEIAALGIPQILSKNCHVPEVEKYGAGFVMDLDNKEVFASKLLETLSDAKAAEIMSANSKRMVEDAFNFYDITRKIEESYKN